MVSENSGIQKKKRGDRAQLGYLDLLTSTLNEHEKNLDGLVERLEKVLGNAVNEKGKSQETLIYIKLILNRSVEELRVILETLRGHVDITHENARVDTMIGGNPEEEREGSNNVDKESREVV